MMFATPEWKADAPPPVVLSTDLTKSRACFCLVFSVVLSLSHFFLDCDLLSAFMREPLLLFLRPSQR